MRSIICLAAVGTILTGLGAAAGCAPLAPSTASDAGPTASPDAGASANEGGAGDAAAAADGAADAPSSSSAQCPTEKPQKIYGAAINAKKILDSDETWTKDNVYIVFGRFSVGKNALTIQAGTTVCFEDDQINPSEEIAGEIDLEDGGAVKMLGSDAEHVVLTSLSGNHWGGVSASFAYKAIELVYTDFYKAGRGGGSPAVNTLNGSDTAPAVKLQHVGFHQLQNKGINIGNRSGLSPDSVDVVFHDYVSTTTSSAYQYPALTIDPIAAGTLTEAMIDMKSPGVPTYARVIALATGGLTKSVTWRKIRDIPYRTSAGGLQIPLGTFTGPMVTLTLEPGVTIRVFGSNPIRVGAPVGSSGLPTGNLVALGTAAQPITFTSNEVGTDLTKPAPGDWQSVFFYVGGFEPNVTKLDYVIFEYGGKTPPMDAVYNCHDGLSNMGAEVILMTPPVPGPYVGPRITNAAFSKSGGQAIRSRDNGGDYLSTDYTDASLTNQFVGFGGTNPGQLPVGTCP